jgi:FAD/FMN-containing dehydrogenase
MGKRTPDEKQGVNEILPHPLFAFANDPFARYSHCVILQPNSVDELAKALSGANGARMPMAAFELSALNRVLEYHPEDLTVTVQAGITLAALQTELAKHRQWLPIDPPDPEHITISQLLNENLSGPRRYGYGTIREHLLGLTAVLPDGRVIHNGGKVVKNVAGFDLCKLFVGSRSTLGVIVEATFKLWPIPPEEVFLCHDFAHVKEAHSAIESILESEMTPTVLDLYSQAFPSCTLVLGLAGTNAEVAWQRELAKKLGFSQPTSLDYDREFWRYAAPVHRVSVLPSRLIAELERIRPETFVARAGNGIVYYRGGSPEKSPAIPEALNRRVKGIFDPNAILPPFDAAFSR